ncbi:Cacna1h [Symbiodinium sp. CCMP2592]|nr:Cacna1h [Symbiodinium sp. CCMP2592]
MKASGGGAESQRPEHGSTPHAQAWADESSDGLSSDSDVEPVQHDERSKQPMHGTAGFRRMRSWQEPPPEVQRALNSLTSFRSALVANQKKMLQLLDDELDRIKGVSGVGVAAPAGRKSQTSANGEVKRFSFPSPFALLPAVQKQRKRRMSWIQKTSPVEPPVPSAPEVVPSLLEGEVANLTREEKEKIRKDADEQVHKGMLTQLDPELARSVVRKRATAEFGEPQEDADQPTGRCYQLAMHPCFERFTMSVIFLNAMWISVDIEFNRAEILSEADAGFIVVENLFCLFFTFELIVRLWTYTRKCSALRDIWFLFDVFLVTLMSFETWLVPLAHAITRTTGDTMTGGASVLRVARVLRVLRTARMARLVRLMPELMILIKGMMVACRSVFFTLVLLLMFTYVFSVAFVQFSRGNAVLESPNFFGSMGTAIWTLLLKCILTDQQFIIEAVAEESWIMAALILVFILFGSLTVMNMLLGVLVEAVKTVSTIEREQLEVDFAKKVLWEMIDKGHADEDGDNRISEQEYRKVLHTPEAMTALTSLGVDVEAALDYGKLLFEDGEPLTFGDFMRGILTLRGSNQTTVKDIVDLRKFTADEFSHIHDILSSLCKYVAASGPVSQTQRPSIASLSSITSSGIASRAEESC